MATVTPGYTFTSNEVVTPTKLNSAATPVVAVADGEVTDAKLAASLNLTTKTLTLPAASLPAAVSVKTANHTLASVDAGTIVTVNSASATTVTVPANSAVPFVLGTQIMIARYGAGELSLVAAAGVTLLSIDSKKHLAKQYSAASVIKTGTDTWLLAGDLKT